MGIESLNDQTIGNTRLRVELVGAARYFDQRDFELYLVDASQRILVFRGKYNTGRPSIYVPTWIDGEFVETQPNAPYAELAERVGTLIPPGGRIWFAYEAFSGEGELMRETRQGLLAQVPIITTPLGYLLFRADCWCGLRDWHIPEGGREGPRKLQGNKAINADHARRRAGEILAELDEFLTLTASSSIESNAQQIARLISSHMQSLVERAP